MGGAVVAAHDDGPCSAGTVQIHGHFQAVGQDVARSAVGIHAGPQHHYGIGRLPFEELGGLGYGVHVAAGGAHGDGVRRHDDYRQGQGREGQRPQAADDKRRATGAIAGHGAPPGQTTVGKAFTIANLGRLGGHRGNAQIKSALTWYTTVMETVALP